MKRPEILAPLFSSLFATICAGQNPPAPDTPPQQQPKVVRTSIPPKAEYKDYENWHAELSAEYWALRPTGDAKTDSFSANLASDLGIEGWKSHPSARAVIQFVKRNKLVVEGMQYRLNGGNLLQRELEFKGRTFAASDQTRSTVKLDSVYAGYERDLLSTNRGFMGIAVGINYLEANAKVMDLTRGAEQVGDTRLAFPVVGSSFRVYPQRSHFLNLNGEIKGMALGNYGKYLSGEMNLGFAVSRTVTLQLGFRALGLDLHDKYQTTGVRATFRGPVISMQWRDR